MSGSMTAIKGLSSWVFRRELKLDTYVVTPALVYKGSHSSSNLKLWGLHLAIRPPASRWSIQCMPMTAGGRVSSAAHLKWKVGGRVQNLLSDPFSLLEIEDPGTDFLDFREILLVQLEPSFT